MPPVLLVIGVALVAMLIAAVVLHHTARSELRGMVIIAAVALGVRLITVGAIYAISSPVHPEGVWLNDEASYFLATGSLLPSPWDNNLPRGLDHLGGNGYLGLTTVTAVLVGRDDAQAYRFVNSTLGTMIVLMCAWLGQFLFGRTAGLVAGVAGALWPDLVLWSATMVRDIVGGFAVISTWWVLQTSSRRTWRSTVCFVGLSLVLLSTLRTYLAVSVGVGVVAWLAWPFVRRQRPRTLAAVAGGLVIASIAILLTQQRRLDTIAHELLYRQTVTRMETLGRLYTDPPPPDQPMQLPFRPGQTIALVDPNTGWLTPGLVEDSATPGQVNVGLVDDTSRSVAIGAHIVLLQDSVIPPLQLFTWTVPSLLSVFIGLPTTNEPPSIVWIGAAVTWDVLLLAGLLGLVRGRLSVRDWLFPLCVIGGTVVALVAIPGSPGNVERHRATQTVPLLLVLVSGLASSRALISRTAGRPAPTPSNMPSKQVTAVTSVRRSAR